MLTVDEALDKIENVVKPLPAERISLTRATGRVLAEPAISDIDSPPFTKSLRDGFAVRADDLASKQATLSVLGTIAAGQIIDKPTPAGSCWKIMTGAPLPPDADSVVMIEQCDEQDNQVVIDDPKFKVGQYVMKQGTEYAEGQIVLQAAHLLGPAEVGLLASIGHAQTVVTRRPWISILATGDEIVPPDQKPGPGQIRNSNEYVMMALIKRLGLPVHTFGVAKDQKAELRSKLEEGINHDVLLVSGGVSAGLKDYVPSTLVDIGVNEVFHQVQVKPGRPLWFGTHDNGLVFGLPGNPVSVLVCFEIFVRTALRRLQGLEKSRPEPMMVPIAHDMNYPTQRVTYHPAQFQWTKKGPSVSMGTWSGSPDLASLANANAFLILHPGKTFKRAGDLVPVLPFESEAHPQS